MLQEIFALEFMRNALLADAAWEVIAKKIGEEERIKQARLLVNQVVPLLLTLTTQ